MIVLGGLLNMGVFLRTGGDFLVHMCALNPNYLEITMTLLLVGVAVYTILGGMLSVLVTDYLQFVVMSAGLVAVTVLILSRIGWSALVAAVEQNYGAGGFNPVANPAMGWQYLVFMGFTQMAAVLTWQTTIARVLAAKDTQTSRKVYTSTSFFFVCRFLIPGIWGIAALATLAPKDFGGNTLLAMPTALSMIVPSGLVGLLVAAMLAADMSTDSSYMLTWSSVIYNNILAPLRKRQWSERRGLLINRMIVGLIGIFLLVYGLWYPLRGNLWDYISITGAIYLSSMSVLLIACCYWNRANSWGATGAIILGAIIPVAYLVMEQLPVTRHFAKDVVGPYYSGIATFVLAGLAMVIGSILKPSTKKRIIEERG